MLAPLHEAGAMAVQIDPRVAEPALEALEEGGQGAPEVEVLPREELDERARKGLLVHVGQQGGEAQPLILAEQGVPGVEREHVAEAGKVVVGPEITARGFAEDDEIFTQVEPKIIAALDEAARKGTTDTHQLQQVVRRAVGGWVGGKIRRRPMIIPVVVEA